MASCSKEGNKESFQWTYEEMLKLCDACIEYINKYGSAQYFNWKEIQVELQKHIDRPCGVCSCKNKYDSMRNEWRLWMQLKMRETGLGWDSCTGLIDASNEWWNKKFKENTKFRRFRNKGVNQILEDKWQQIFGDSYAKGNNVYIPSMDLLSPSINLENEGEDEINDDYENVDEENTEANLQSFECALMDEDIFVRDFIEPISIPTQNQRNKQSINIEEHFSIRTSKGKQKVISNNLGVQKKRKGRQSGGAVKAAAQIEDLMSMCRNVSLGAPNCEVTSPSISTVTTSMQIIRNMVENGDLEPGSELWGYAIHLQEDVVKREIFINLGENDSRLHWLKYMYQAKEK